MDVGRERSEGKGRREVNGGMGMEACWGGRSKGGTTVRDGEGKGGKLARKGGRDSFLGK